MSERETQDATEAAETVETETVETETVTEESTPAGKETARRREGLTSDRFGRLDESGFESDDALDLDDVEPSSSEPVKR